MASVSRTRRPLLALLALLALLGTGYGVKAADDGGSSTQSDTVQEARLPAQARRTIDLIERHGPYPFREDGEVFYNDEHDLPRESTGFYHSYTVITPGSDDRGERRIVTGRDGRFWYTDDHYDSFERVTGLSTP